MLINFREQVVHLVRRIPKGKIVSYGQIARVLGRPRTSRVVGGILSNLDPDDNLTPWQRVLNKKGMVSHREDPFTIEHPVTKQTRILMEEGLEPNLKGEFSFSEAGLSDEELLALFGTEMLELVDRENNPIGIAPRSTVRSENLLHRGVGILCWNSKGELYVHQRTSTKDLYPSYYDMMVGGALQAGEKYESSALREAQEELGIGEVPIHFLMETLYEGPRNKSYIQLFELCWDGPITWQEEEIAWGQWMGFEKVLSWLETVPVVPDGLQVFREYLALRSAS